MEKYWMLYNINNIIYNVSYIRNLILSYIISTLITSNNDKNSYNLVTL